MADSGVTIRSGDGAFLLVRRQEMVQLRLAETLYSNEVMEANHSHQRAYFEIVLKGAYTDYDKQRILEHRPLSIAFQPVIDAHTSHIHPAGLHSLKIEMSSEWLKRIGDSLDRPSLHCLDTPVNFANGMLPWLGIRLYNEWQKMDIVSPLIIEGLVLEMLAEAIRSRGLSQEPSPPRWLKKAEDLLHAEFAEPLTLEYIAQAIGVHPVYLARAFRQQRQCTIGDYIRRLRIEYACKELTTSEAPLADIALSAGFADQSHFSKVFKRLVGMSPNTFRNCCSTSIQNQKTRVYPEL